MSRLDRARDGSDRGMGIVTRGVYKVFVIAVWVIDVGRGNCAPPIGIWRDERTELGASMVWVKFIVNLFPDELYRLMLAPRNKVLLHTCLQQRLRG